MPTLEKLNEDRKKMQEHYKENFRSVQATRDNETPAQKETRRRMSIEWDEIHPILECRWYIDQCVYDGERLNIVSTAVESSVLGEIDFKENSGFMIHNANTSIGRGEHFEQCSECLIVYRMGPSPKELERLRTLEVQCYGQT